ncbi:MAG TPA: OmpA family protein [Blastocatellia bacterium]|nr:OmpA family protein [Blastocatellia bacterium]
MRLKSLSIITAVLFLLILPSFALAQSGGDVTFDTVAVTYPEGKEVKLDLTGTELGLKASGKAISGKATIEHNKGVTSISLRIGGFSPAARLGSQYTTYVLWAVTPEGQFQNLGEFRRRGSDTFDVWLGTPFKTATHFQTFSLIITAEPYSMVETPSRTVIVSNRPPVDRGIQSEPTTISFPGDSEVAMLKFTPDREIGREEYNKIPVELLGARRAMDVARFFQADQYAPQSYAKASEMLDTAERQFSQRQYDESADTAQRAIALAESARSLAVTRKKAKEARDLINQKDEEIAKLEDIAKASDKNRYDAEKKLERETASKEKAEDRLRQLEEDLERSKSDVKRYTDEIARANNDLKAERDKNADLQNKLNDMQAKQIAEANQKALIEQAVETQKEINANFETKQDDRGYIVIIPDSFFRSATSTDLKDETNSKLDIVAKFLVTYSDRKVRLESYTDNAGTEESRQELANKRGQAVVSYLELKGVKADQMTAIAMGNNNPRATNKSVIGRERNRRIELIIPITPDVKTDAKSTTVKNDGN